MFSSTKWWLRGCVITILPNWETWIIMCKCVCMCVCACACLRTVIKTGHCLRERLHQLLCPCAGSRQAKSPQSMKGETRPAGNQRRWGAGFGLGRRWDGKEDEEISLFCLQLQCSPLSLWPSVFHVVFYSFGFSCSASFSLQIPVSLSCHPPFPAYLVFILGCFVHELFSLFHMSLFSLLFPSPASLSLSLSLSR